MADGVDAISIFDSSRASFGSDGVIPPGRTWLFVLLPKARNVAILNKTLLKYLWQ